MALRMIAALCLIQVAAGALATITAWDSAADPVYSGGWSSGQNGGYGLVPWSLYPTAGTAFVGDSNANGAGGGPGINSAGRAWGINAPFDWSAYPYFYRGISGPVGLGDTISWDVDLGAVGTSGVHQFGVGHVFMGLDGGASSLWFQDDSGRVGTSIGATDGGLHIEYQWTGSTSAVVRVTVLATSFTHSLTANAPVGTYFVGQAMFSGPTHASDMYFNNMKVETVPEPSTLALIGIAGVPLLRRRRSR